MTPLPIDPTPLPLTELLAFFSELSQSMLDEKTNNASKKMLENFNALKAKYLSNKGYETMSLGDFYHLTELNQAGLSSYVFDPDTINRVSPVLKVVPGTPQAPEVGFIIAHHDEVLIGEELHQNLRYRFLSNGVLSSLHPNAIFFKLNRHAELIDELKTYHNSLKLDNLYAEQPEPISVLEHLSAPIEVSHHFRAPATFYPVDESPSAAAYYCGTLFTGANDEAFFKPVINETDCASLSAEEEQRRYWVGDYVRVKELEYRVAEVDLTRIGAKLTQTLKGPTGAVLVKDLPVMQTSIKLSDRGMLWRYCYDRPSFGSHEEHLAQAIELENYVILSKADQSPYTHFEALEALLTGHCDYIQFEENFSGWVCARFGDQQGLRSAIQEKIRKLKERSHV